VRAIFICGTAGHIDHGKSALVKALTSIDPDRLPEEKRRGMTIDLGFAWLPLSSGEVVGIVDVPGHKDLIKNLIAGVWGVDFVLLVIAADEGWMPQTEEHLQILDLFHIEHGIVVITKVDLIDNLDWLDLVEEDIRERLKNTGLADAPILRVSARKGTNIDELKRSVEALISKMAPKRDINKPRLPIDRVFTIKGSGTVVTGTLVDGSLLQGEKVTIFPRNLHSRARTIEIYKQRTDRVQPSTRVAINLVGLEKETLKRGDILFGREEQIRASKILDVEVELIPQLTNPLQSNTELMVYLGTKEILGRIILLERRVLKPGESAFAQFRFKEQVAARIGDHFIIRKPSPEGTIGGGVVLDPLGERHKLKDIDKVIFFLRKRGNLEIQELILSELGKNKYIKQEDLLVASLYSADEISSCVRLLNSDNKLVVMNSWVIDAGYWQKQIDESLTLLSRKHSLSPWAKGLPQAELQNQLGLPREASSKLISSLIKSARIVRDGDIISLSTHKPQLSPDQESIASSIIELFERDQSNPPTKREVEIQIPGSEEVVQFMCEQNMLIELPGGVLFEYKHYNVVKNEIINFLRSNSTISIQQVRELFGFSRKYVLPLLSELDEEGVIQRRGDERVLVQKHG
jgi:selenocysteine-specific elongation factor